MLLKVYIFSGVVKMAPQPDIMVENAVTVEEEIVANTVEIAYEAPKEM